MRAIDRRKQLEDLLFSADIQKVKRGLRLIQALASSASELKAIMGFLGEPNVWASWQQFWMSKPNGHRILGALLQIFIDWEEGWFLNLKTLDLRGCQMTELPVGINKLASLEALDLRDNQLKKLPSFAGMRALKSIRWAGNPLEECEKLDFFGCQLTNLPEDIQELPHLKGVDLSFNRLSQVPKLDHLSLNWICIQGNPLDLNRALSVFQAHHFDVQRCMMSIVDVPAGSFWMGALPDDHDAIDDERPRHRVIISQPLQVMRVPMTQRLYRWIMNRDSELSPEDSLPKNRINWIQAAQCANALSEWAKQPQVYDIDWDDVMALERSTGWRFPTEAEWEYLARGAEYHLYAGSNQVEDVAIIDNITALHPVGQRRPNAFGLFDMTNQLSEWCSDWAYRIYDKNLILDPQGHSGGSERMCRGGMNLLNHLVERVSVRERADFKMHTHYTGFRLVRNPHVDA